MDRAREVLEIVPENEHYFTNVMIKPCGNWVYSQIARLTHHDGVKFNVSFKLLEEWKPKFVNLKDLKRLVESLDLIKFYDGIERAKLKLAMGTCLSGRPPHPREVELRRAIRDHESIYGGGQ
ncbi:hypothetical protein JUNP543_3271 [Acinetobacter baumannii]